MKRCLLGACVFALLLAGPLHAQAPVHATRTFRAGAADAAYDTRRFLLGPGAVTDEKDGSTRLAASVLLTDEMGATDYRQTEALSDRVQVKKVFVLDSTQLNDAELFFYGSAKQIRVNGKAVSPPQRLVSTGWGRVTVPPEILKVGANEIVFSGGGGLLLEPGRGPGRSFKSSDGGKSWSARTLGKDGDQQGEYLIRLRLGRHTPEARVASQVFDLWAARTGEVGTSGKVTRFHSLAALAQKQPDDTRLKVSLRTGATPAPDEKSWTAWMPLERDYRPDVRTQGHRWAQLRFHLSTARPQATPRLPARFELAFDFQASAPASAGKLTVSRPKRHDLAIGATPFVYQAPSPRVKLLRERYRLDQVIAAGKTEMEQLMLLRYWVRNQWHTAWGSNAAAWMPPWDALIILESKDQPDCLTMCTHYAAVFTQCAVALGWNARHCILDHHCVAEVYVTQHRKWAMMDAGNSAQRADVGLHFERNGVPLSALELHLAQRSGKTADITVHFTPARLVEKVAPLCRPAPATAKKGPPRPDVIPLAELHKFPVCQLDNYRRYAFPPRNNYLTSLVPGELYQGWSEYFYDGYCWVGDTPDNPQISPEYSQGLSPSRPQDIDWSLNWSRIHLSATGKPGEVRVDVETDTPNLARLEKQTAAGKEAWGPTPPSFVWRLQPGVNVLAVRGVNHWGKAGSEDRVRVEWSPIGR